MSFRSEFLFSDLPDYIQIGGDFVDRIGAVRQCYDLKNRMPYIVDYRVLDENNRIIFSRGKPSLVFGTKVLLKVDDDA